MTAETAAQPERQVLAQGGDQQMVRYGIVLAALANMLLRDRRFHVAVIMRAIGAVALASLIKNNQARPMRRTTSWYKKLGDSREAGPRTSAGPPARAARAGQALEAGKRS